MSFPRYSAYKDSGLDWLGPVPAHWLLAPAKHQIASLSGGQSTKNTVSQEPLEGLFAAYSASGQDIWMEEYEFDCTGIVLSAVGARCGKAFKADGRWGVVANTHCLFPKNGACRDYLWYLMNREEWWERGGTAQPFIKVRETLSRKWCFPDPQEQAAIAIFLDSETAKIDSLVEEQRRLIELLKEKRQAVISQAVAKGLNPNVPMKDSGVEWLGNVPAHWTVCALRRVIVNIEQGWSPECDAAPADDQSWGVLKAGCVNRGVFEPSENKSLPDLLTPIAEYEVRSGDVLVSRASGSPELVGSAALVGETRSKLMLSDKIFRVHLTSQMTSPFFVWAMNGKALRDQIERALSGGNGLANNLPQSAMLAFLVAVPPAEEQRIVSTAIEGSVRKCDELIAEAARAVDFLLERRAALISAAVTGKIDVRGLVLQPEAVAA